MHQRDVAGGFSDLEMTLLFYCAGATTVRTDRENRRLWQIWNTRPTYN